MVVREIESHYNEDSGIAVDVFQTSGEIRARLVDTDVNEIVVIRGWSIRKFGADGALAEARQWASRCLY